MVLPHDLALSVEAIAQGTNRPELRRAAAELSRQYKAADRSAGSMQIKLGSAVDRLAYVAVRMPATYAAVRAALLEHSASDPDFAPTSLLDLGAGPGTASFAAESIWPTISRARLVDRNKGLSDLGSKIANHLGSRLESAERVVDSFGSASMAWGQRADLVLLTYVLGEMGQESGRQLVRRAWDHSLAYLVIVEPGSTPGYRRVLAARQQLIDEGAHIVAPCPHNRSCPLATSTEWCHFAQRLDRSRLHRQAKRGSVSFEDEPFSYVVATRKEDIAPSASRVIRRPYVTKAEAMVSLCATAGLKTVRIKRTKQPAYAAARRLSWGDGLSAEAEAALSLEDTRSP